MILSLLPDAHELVVLYCWQSKTCSFNQQENTIGDTGAILDTTSSGLSQAQSGCCDGIACDHITIKYLDGFPHAHFISQDASPDLAPLLGDGPGQKLLLEGQQGHQHLGRGFHLLIHLHIGTG
jgi:hypothetical protein